MAAQEIEYDRTLLGVEFPTDPVMVDNGVIQRYCNATGISAPIHTDQEAAKTAGYRDLVIPITMYPSLARRQRPDIKLKFGRRQLFSSQSIEALVPVCAGDQVGGAIHLKEVYAKTGRSGTMVFMVWETVVTNQWGQRVAVIRDSYVRAENLHHRSF
jgi:acyl dehydratase